MTKENTPISIEYNGKTVNTTMDDVTKLAKKLETEAGVAENDLNNSEVTWDKLTKVILSSDEIRQEGFKLAQAEGKKQELEEKKKEFNDQIKSELSEQESIIKSSSGLIRSGCRWVTVPHVRRINEARGVYEYVYKGEVTCVEPLPEQRELKI